MRDPHAFLELVLQADDPDEAQAALQERLGLDWIQAAAVLDMQFRRATNRDRRRSVDRRQELTDHLRFLQSLRPLA